MNQAQSPQGPLDAHDKQNDLSSTRVRRRNRMITSCLECRRRKLKCDKQQPCTNCLKFSRDCMFLAPALDSVSQKKLNEIKDKMGSLERTLEDNVARRQSEGRKHRERRESADLPGEGSESEEGPVPEDEKGLAATPLATVDATYEDDSNDDFLDLGFRVGKFRMTERLGGLFRPKIAEELSITLVSDINRGIEPEVPLKDDNHTFLDPGSSFAVPGSGFVYGDAGPRRSIVDFLPTKAVSDLLMRRYHNNVHQLCRVVHWPSFQLQHENFWTSILAGVEPHPSLQALVFAVSYAAITSMSHSEVDSVFQQRHRQALAQFQTATEVALGKAQFLRTTKFSTLQALIIYLIPMCRGEVSRAHSVLVGAAIRLGECFGLHRDPVDTSGHTPVDAQIRRLAWFQLCFLDLRTAEAQGPRPSVKREDYDTKLPWNLDDADLSNVPSSLNQQAIDLREKEGQWTDATLSKIRFECCEMHRIVWHDRVRLDKQKITITHCMSKIEAFRRAMGKKYAWLDETITVQHYAKLLLDVLLLRMHVMILHKYHNGPKSRISDRLLQILISSGTALSESAVKLDIDHKFQCFQWYNSALQQWHTAFLLLIEVFSFPNRRESDRIWRIADHVFEPDLTLSRPQKARSILGAIRDRAAAYKNLRKMKAPLSMHNQLSTSLAARGKTYEPDMVRTVTEQPRLTGENGIQAVNQANRRFSNTLGVPGQSFTRSGVPWTTVAGSMPELASDSSSTSVNDDSARSWSFDSPYTMFVPAVREHKEPLLDQAAFSATTSPSYTGGRNLSESSPSNSSHTTDQWPPNFTSTLRSPHFRSQNTMSPPYSAVSPSDASTSPSPMFGNTALGLVSGEYIPPNSRTLPRALSPPDLGTGYFNQPISMNSSRRTAAFSPTQTQHNPRPEDVAMIDIDWNEWDKLFPPEVNNGHLDLPIEVQAGR